MKYHEKEVNKNLNRLDLIKMVSSFVSCGLIGALILNKGMPINSFSDFLGFLFFFLLIGTLAFVPLLAIFHFIEEALGIEIKDIYKLGYSDGQRDTLDNEN